MYTAGPDLLVLGDIDRSEVAVGDILRFLERLP